MSRKLAIDADGRTVHLSSPDKQLVDGVTKRELAEHWVLAGPMTVAAAPRRLISAKRVPDGPGGEVFFQKNQPAGMPGWVQVARVPRSTEEKGHTDHVVLADVAHLVALAQFGTVEVHVGTWDVEAPFRPREVVLDLDPPPDAPVADVRAALRRTLALTDEVGLPTRVKTTGSKGFHVHVPVEGVDQDLARDVAALLARELVRRHPEELTTEFHKQDRRGRVLVDVWRNSGGATAVVVWSPRVAPGAPVARPLTRTEVDEDLDAIVPNALTVPDVPAFLDEHGDPWADPLAPVGADDLERVVSSLRDA